MIHRSVHVACLMSLTAATGAAATHLPPTDYAPETAIDGEGQGWYMRGDLGYTGWTGDRTPSFNTFTGGAVTATDTFDEARFGKHMSYGFGAGYQFNDLVRADATLDFFNVDFSGQTVNATPCAGQAAGTTTATGEESDFRGISLLGNAYVDLGTVAGFTPYVGGGAGVTNVAWSTVTNTPFCVAGTAACNGTAYASTDTEGMDSWRFTYALMAGVSYDIAANMKLDLGYRFTRISGGDMSGYSAAEQAAGASGAKNSDDGLSRHEIRAGLRVTTW